MEKRYSKDLPSTVANTNSQQEVAYQCDRGTETIHIDEELLTTVEVANARAEAEFLKQSYKEKSIAFTTYHIDGVQVGTIIKVDDILYKVTSATDTIDGVKVVLKVIAKRWE